MGCKEEAVVVCIQCNLIVKEKERVCLLVLFTLLNQKWSPAILLKQVIQMRYNYNGISAFYPYIVGKM